MTPLTVSPAAATEGFGATPPGPCPDALTLDEIRQMAAAIWPNG